MSVPAVVPEAERAAHMAKVQDRLAAGDAIPRARAAEMSKRVVTEQRERMVRQAVHAKTATQRVHWLRREADLVNAAAAGLTACEGGCSSCCNIGLSLTESEATVIGKAIGRTPASPGPDKSFTPSQFLEDEDGDAKMQAARAKMDEAYYGVPCPFLKDDRCSIYAERPMACRHQISMAVDDLLCRLVPGERIPVPYVNMRSQQVAYIAAMGAGARFADIRDWFPPEA